MPKTPEGNQKKIAEEAKVLGMRLALAQQYTWMLHEAFDALLHYGINYRDLPNYKRAEVVMKEADALSVEDGQAHLAVWVNRVRKDLQVAVRRKQWRVHQASTETA